MLSTHIQEKQTDIKYPDGYPHDAALDGIRSRVRSAQKFVLDPHAVAMAASVAMSKPSSILKSLAFMKLPADQMWIEFANEDTRNAMANLGSPNKPDPNARVRVERTGFLLTEDKNSINMEYVHSDWIQEMGGSVIDLAPVRARFIKSQYDEQVNPADMHALRERVSIDSGAKDKVRQHLNLISRDADEARAAMELRDRLQIMRHQDMAIVRQNLVGLQGEMGTSSVEANQGTDLLRMWELQILPALILLNCRNAVDVETVAAPEKLNKQRVKKGKAPIQEHQVVKIHLSPSKRRSHGIGPGRSGPTNGGLVIGHFKVRKSGIYWWSPHWRGPAHEGTIERTYVITQ